MVWGYDMNTVAVLCELQRKAKGPNDTDDGGNSSGTEVWHACPYNLYVQLHANICMCCMVFIVDRSSSHVLNCCIVYLSVN